MNFDPAYWGLQCAAMLLTCFLIPRLTVSGPIAALLTVVCLSFINAHLWSAALFLKVPDTLAYKAILLFLANGVLFWIVVKVLPGIDVEGILPALIAPVVFSILSILIDKYKDQIDWPLVWKTIVEIFNNIKEYFNKMQNSALLPNIPFVKFSNFA